MIPIPVMRPDPVEIWNSPCKHCPSAHYPPDPEALDQARYYREGALTPAEAVFPCAWRPERICRGIADELGITEETLHDHRLRACVN